MSDKSNTKKQYVCLDFRGAKCTYIETDEDFLDQEDDFNSWFAEKGISEVDALGWAKKNLTVIFDGNLDNPEKFKFIKAIGIYGPNFFGIGKGAPSISKFAVYLEVEGYSELSEEELEDIFHSVIPVIESDNSIVAFTEFENYSVLFEAPTTDVRPVNVIWPKVE